MKTDFASSDCKPSVSVVSTQPQGSEAANRKHAPSRRYCIRVVTGGLVLVAMVSAVIVTAFVVGNKLTRETFQEGWLSVRTEDGMVTEKVTLLSDHEEEIMVPGQYRCLVDHTRRLMVMKTFEDNACLVIPFNVTMLPSRENIESALNTDNTDKALLEVGDAKKSTWKIAPSRIAVSPNILTKTANNMCQDSTAVWAIATEDQGDLGGDRQRRAATEGTIIIIIIEK